jgi:hypothetical protein
MSDATNTRTTLPVRSHLEHSALVHACAAVRDQEERAQDAQLGDGRNPSPGFDLEASDRRIAESWMLADQLDSVGTVDVPLGIADEIAGYLARLTAYELEGILGSTAPAPVGVHIQSRMSLIGLRGSLSSTVQHDGSAV